MVDALLDDDANPQLKSTVYGVSLLSSNQSINQKICKTHLPFVANESEAHNGSLTKLTVYIYCGQCNGGVYTM